MKHFLVYRFHRGLPSSLFLAPQGTVDFSSEITISSSFTAEHAENAEASGNPNGDWNVLKLCALGDLRGDKSLGF